MAVKYTEEQLHTIDKPILIQMLLQSQEQVSSLTDEVHTLNEKMQLIMEQLVLANRNRFGRSSEKMANAEQICFQEVDGNIVFFNEAEAVCDLDAPEPEDLERPKTGDSNRPERKSVTCPGFRQHHSIIT